MASEMSIRPSLDVVEPEKSIKTAEFFLFSNLPPELRFKIWDYALPGPRIALIKFNKRHLARSSLQTGNGLAPGGSNDLVLRPASFAQPCVTTPSLLHVNREARQRALKRYSVYTFEHRTSGQLLNIYADLKFDCLYFSTSQDAYRSLRHNSDLTGWIIDVQGSSAKRISMSTGEKLPLGTGTSLRALVFATHRPLDEDSEKMEFINLIEGHMGCEPPELDPLGLASLKSRQEIGKGARVICTYGPFEIPDNAAMRRLRFPDPAHVFRT